MTGMGRIGMFWILLLAGMIARAQGSGKIHGQVTTTDGNSVQGASALLMVKDSVWRKTSIDSTGQFLFANIPVGSYRVKISFIGYQEWISADIAIDAQHPTQDMGSVTLKAQKKELQEVVVTAQKNFVEQKVDRTVVNVNAMISNTGAHALEVLEKTPGIIVDENGNVIFKGKSGVIILIDDKPTYLAGEALANYLRSLPASQLDKIELMTTPPAKYDASGNAGVINIRTKKLQTKGFNGNLAASVGKAMYWRTLESVSLNYRVNKWNFFTNIGFGVQNNYRRLDVGRTYFDNSGNILSAYHETAYFHPINYNTNIKAGADYAVTPKTSVGFVFTRVSSPGTNINPTNSAIISATGKTDSVIIADNNTTSDFTNTGINLNYAQQFAKSGRLLTVDLDLVKYDAMRDQIFRNNTYNNNGALTYSEVLNSGQPASIDIFTLKSDYSHALNRNAKLEAGFKSSYVNTDNAANYFYVIGDIYSPDYDKTNRFLYRENINAAYLSYNNEWKRFSFKTGLRMENTNIDAHQLGNAVKTDSAFQQHYTGIFPTAYLSYKLDTTGSHTLTFSYARRIDRPSYQSLNPFTVYVDKYSTWTGNPFLRPQYASSLQLIYAYKSIFSVTLQHGYTSDFQSEVDLQEGDLFVARTLNIGHRINKGISLYLGMPIKKWWSFTWNAEIYNNAFEGQIPGKYLKTEMTSFYTTMNNTIVFGKGWSGELSGFYVSGGQYSQFVSHKNGQINTGVQKKILKDKGALKLTIRDLFRSNINKGWITNIPNVDATYRNDNAQRAVVLGFTWSFGSSASNNKKRDSGAQTEQNRVNL
jgi:outer membrane receptor protein involved in Fe transport